MLCLRAVIVSLLLLVPLVSPSLAQPKPEKPASTAGQVDFRPKFKKGQEVRYVIRMESRESGGEEGKSSNQTEMGIVLRCTEANSESGFKLDMVYESMKMKVEQGEMSVDFDSTKPAKADDPFDAALRSIVGLTLPVTMDNDGNISTVGGGLSELAGMISGEATGADVIKSIFGPISTDKKSPGKAAVGESWTTEDTMSGSAGQMRLTMTHTLASHVGGKAQINTTGKVALEPSSGGGAMPQVRISDSTITGKTTWDTELGMLSDMDSVQKITVQTRAGNEPAKSTTQEMNVRVTRKK